MTSAVVDTNVIVSGMISESPASASRGVIDALFSRMFRLILSPETLDEILFVLFDSEIRQRHGASDEQILDFCLALESLGQIVVPTVPVAASLTRDVTDTKWVSLAIHTRADFLVTNDQRHLRRLHRLGSTRIVTPRAFLKQLDDAP